MPFLRPRKWRCFRCAIRGCGIWRKKAQAGAKTALALLAQPGKLLSVTQIGVTLASLGLGWAGEDTLYAAVDCRLSSRAHARHGDDSAGRLLSCSRLR